MSDPDLDGAIRLASTCLRSAVSMMNARNGPALRVKVNHVVVHRRGSGVIFLA
jgi:hypothetical protein